MPLLLLFKLVLRRKQGGMGGWSLPNEGSRPPKICVIEKLGSSLLRMNVVFLHQYGDTTASGLDMHYV